MKQVFILCIILSLFWSCEKEKENETNSDPDIPKTVPESPIAKFEIYSLIVKRGETVQFSNKSENAISFLWDFGDGSTSKEENPIHTFNNSGWHKITLTASKDAGTDSLSRELLVKDITVMTYNIAFSAGAVTELYEMWNGDGQRKWSHERRPQILNIIRTINPDILGIQEAFLWDSYSPKVYEEFADSLNMPYCYFPEYEEAEWNGICIYSKFPIESTDFLLHQPCEPNRVWNGTFMVKAKIKIAEEQFIDVITCHLSPEGSIVRSCEIQMLHDYLKNSIYQNTIVMGDMNFTFQANTVESRTALLRNLGLRFLDSRKVADRDHIWATKDLHLKSMIYHKKGIDDNSLTSVLPEDIYNILSQASDHQPVIAHFGL